MTPPRRRFGMWLRPSRRMRIATLQWELEVALEAAADWKRAHDHVAASKSAAADIDVALGERAVRVYLDGQKIAEATTRKCPARIMVAGVALTCDMKPDHDGIHQSPLRLEGGVVARIHWRGIHGGPRVTC